MEPAGETTAIALNQELKIDKSSEEGIEKVLKGGKDIQTKQNEALMCECCLEQFSSKYLYEEHKKSETHLKKSQTLKKTSEDVKEKTILSQDKKRTQEVHICKVCDIDCVTIKNFHDHVGGRRHLKAAYMQEKLRLMEEAFKDCPERKLLLHFPKDFKSPLVGLEYVVEFQLEDDRIPSFYVCKLCKQYVHKADIRGHVTSKDHRLTFIRKTDSDFYEKIKKSPPEKCKEELRNYAEETEKKEGRKLSEVKVKYRPGFVHNPWTYFELYETDKKRYHGQKYQGKKVFAAQDDGRDKIDKRGPGLTTEETGYAGSYKQFPQHCKERYVSASDEDALYKAYMEAKTCRLLGERGTRTLGRGVDYNHYHNGHRVLGEYNPNLSFNQGRYGGNSRPHSCRGFHSSNRMQRNDYMGGYAGVRTDSGYGDDEGMGFQRNYHDMYNYGGDYMGGYGGSLHGPSPEATKSYGAKNPQAQSGPVFNRNSHGHRGCGTRYTSQSHQYHEQSPRGHFHPAKAHNFC